MEPKQFIPVPEPADPPLAQVGVYDDEGAAAARGLVVLAMGLPYWLMPAGEGWALCVPVEAVQEVGEQLARFEQESRDWPPQGPGTAERRGSSGHGLLVVAGLLVACHGAVGAAHPSVRSAGVLDAAAVFTAGEIWRAFTALTLHADLAHLAGNIAGLALFGHFVARRFGGGLAWLLILLAGGSGNLATAWIFREPGHVSLGASTAVFGALGLLAGSSVWAATRDRAGAHLSGHPLLPLAAALVLLGLLGAGGPRIDVVAHVSGFALAFPLGALAFAQRWQQAGSTRQRICALAAVAWPAVAWMAALAWGR